MKFVYTGSIEGGVLKMFNRKQFEKDINAFKTKDVIITIENKKKQRSTPQNAYYWACLVPMVHSGLRDMGHEVELSDTHEFLKSNFNCQEIVDESTGEIYRMPKSTTELTTVGFNEFLAKVQKWAAEFLNINIPNPNEQVQIFTNNTFIK